MTRRGGFAYVVSTSWNLWIGTLHRVWMADTEECIEDDSCTLWGWDWRWKS